MKIEANPPGLLARSDELVDEIRPMLAGENPEVVGAVIGQLLAIFIASNHPQLRTDTRAMLLDMVDSLVPLIIEEMIEEGKCTAEWRNVGKKSN